MIDAHLPLLVRYSWIRLSKPPARPSVSMNTVKFHSICSGAAWSFRCRDECVELDSDRGPGARQDSSPPIFVTHAWGNWRTCKRNSIRLNLRI